MKELMSKTRIILEKLNGLTERAKVEEPNLAGRLIQIQRPIQKLREGDITSRKYLLKGLEEIIADCEIWLDYITMSYEEKTILKNTLQPIERYWYFVMFPAWFQQEDKRFDKWREHLIKGTPLADDFNTIREMNKRINKQNLEKYINAALLQKLIADKAMVTDLMIIGSKAKTLCVQMTQNSQHYTYKKEIDWQDTLIYWGVKRGLFIRYNPRNKDFINKLLDCMLCNSDLLSEGEYPKVNI